MQENLSRAVRAALDAASRKIQVAGAKDRRSSDFWTRVSKDEFCLAASNEGCYACSSGSVEAARHGEWLYDVSWLRYRGGFSENAEARYFQGVALAVESEWKRKRADLLDDFEKLLQSRAELCLMIFEITSKRDFDEIVLFLRERIDRCIPGEETRFRFAGFYENSSMGFEFQ